MVKKMEMNKSVKDIFAKANAIREKAKLEEPKKIVVEQLEMPAQTNAVARHVGVTGIHIRNDGTITKNDYLKKLELDPSMYSNMNFTEEEVMALTYAIKRQSSGINSAVPIRCSGDMCPFKASCAYMAIGKPPLAKPCLVESQLIHYWTEQYIDEFNVDPSNITELHMVSELAEFNIYEMRVTKYLAENHPTLLQDVVVGVDASGNVIENQDISKAFELKDRIKKNRMKVLEALMATRKEKMKVVSEVVGGGNTMTKLSELKSKISELSSQMKTMKAVDADFREIK